MRSGSLRGEGAIRTGAADPRPIEPTRGSGHLFNGSS
jgi:hypothetical protein